MAREKITWTLDRPKSQRQLAMEAEAELQEAIDKQARDFAQREEARQMEMEANASQTTFYMVAEIGYEYNDEVYHRPESGGMTDVTLFRRKDKAEQAAAAMTLKSIKNEELSHFGYDINDILPRHDKVARRAFEDLIEQYSPGFDFGDGWEALQKFDQVIKQMPADDAAKLLSYTSIRFFEVKEVELED